MWGEKNPAFKARFFGLRYIFINLGTVASCKNSLLLLYNLLHASSMIDLSDYGIRVVARINLILTWLAVLVCVRNGFICYGQWKRTRGSMWVIAHLIPSFTALYRRTARSPLYRLFQPPRKLGTSGYCWYPPYSVWYTAHLWSYFLRDLPIFSIVSRRRRANKKTL